MKKSKIVFIIVIIVILLTLTACMPSTPEELTDKAKTTWGNAYARAINDVITIKNIKIVAPIKATLTKNESISTLITLDIYSGQIIMERKIIGNTYYLDFVLKNLKGVISGNLSELINQIFKIENLSEMEVRLCGKLVRDKVTLSTVVTGLDKISGGSSPRLENIIFNAKTFDPVVTSVIKMLMQQNLFGTIPPTGVIDADAQSYKYAYDDSDKINSEFMRLPKLVVDAIKDINFKPGWRTLAEILNNNFNTTDFVKITQQYIEQEPVEIKCFYAIDKFGTYFNAVETELNLSIPKLPKYFFGQMLELVGVTGIEITDDCSAEFSVGYKTEMTIDKALAQ